MINPNNETIKITLSKKQINWLNEVCEKLQITKSKFIKFVLSKNLGNLLSRYSEEDIQWMIKIAKTPWLEEED